MHVTQVDRDVRLVVLRPVPLLVPRLRDKPMLLGLLLGNTHVQRRQLSRAGTLLRRVALKFTLVAQPPHNLKPSLRVGVRRLHPCGLKCGAVFRVVLQDPMKVSAVQL